MIKKLDVFLMRTFNSVIPQSVQLPVTLSTGDSMTISFYLTPLNLSCSVVLGHN